MTEDQAEHIIALLEQISRNTGGTRDYADNIQIQTSQTESLLKQIASTLEDIDRRLSSIEDNTDNLNA